MLKHQMKNDRGSALVELALTLPLFVCIIVGAVELGRVAYFAIELTNAARAGAGFGSQDLATAFQTGSNGQFDPTFIEAAAQNDAPDITLTWNNVPTHACTCETIYYDGSASTYNPATPGNCGTATNPNPPIYSCGVTTSTYTQQVVSYIQVSPQATISTIFKYPGIPTSFTLTGYAQMRVLPNGD